MSKIDSNRVKEWFSNPYNAGMVLIALAAFVIRLIFYLKTQNQALWWDEAEYLSTAKSWAFGVPYDYNPQRPPLFQAISALAFLIGLGEGFIKFALVLLPSVALVISIYYLAKEMFNERVGLMSSIFASVSWTFLFWTSRVQPDFFSMTFQVLSILFMWKFWKGAGNKFSIYAGIFAALGFYFKVSALLVPVAFMVYILIKDRLEGFKIKGHYYFAIAFIVTLIPYMIWSMALFGNPFAFKQNYSIAFTEEVARPLGWYNVQFLYLLTEGLFFILFAVAALASMKWIFYPDVLMKDRKKCFNPNIFAVITILLVSAFYIFYIRGTEDRWVFLWLPFMAMFASQTLDFIYSKFGKDQRRVAIAIVVLLIGICSYSQLNHASQLIEQKIPSYMPVKNAGLWVNQNYDSNTKLLSISYTQSVYYSEVNVSTYSTISDPDAFNDYIGTVGAKLVQVSAWEQHPQWINEWISQNSNNLVPVFTDSKSASESPTVIIFEVK